MNYSNNDIRTHIQPNLSSDIQKRIERVRTLSKNARTHQEKKNLASMLQMVRLKAPRFVGTIAAIAAVGLLALSESKAATSFLPTANFGSDAAAGAAEWDFFTVAEGSHGSSTSLSGPNAPTTTDLTNSILVNIESPGGLLGGGDSYYSHSGAYSWDLTATFSIEVEYARVSYALVGGGMGAPSAFPNAPAIDGASLIGSGEYGDPNGNTIFYYDFSLDGGATEIASSFGDTPAPFSSFRSINGVHIEGLSTTPVSIPEPSSALLLGSVGVIFLLRRKRS